MKKEGGKIGSARVRVSVARGSKKALTMLLSNPIGLPYGTRPDSVGVFVICYHTGRKRAGKTTTQISNWTRLDIPVQFILHQPTNDNAQLYYTSYHRIQFSRRTWATYFSLFSRREMDKNLDACEFRKILDNLTSKKNI